MKQQNRIHTHLTFKIALFAVLTILATKSTASDDEGDSTHGTPSSQYGSVGQPNAFPIGTASADTKEAPPGGVPAHYTAIVPLPTALGAEAARQKTAIERGDQAAPRIDASASVSSGGDQAIVPAAGAAHPQYGIAREAQLQPGQSRASTHASNNVGNYGTTPQDPVTTSGSSNSAASSVPTSAATKSDALSQYGGMPKGPLPDGDSTSLPAEPIRPTDEELTAGGYDQTPFMSKQNDPSTDTQPSGNDTSTDAQSSAYAGFIPFSTEDQGDKKSSVYAPIRKSSTDAQTDDSAASQSSRHGRKKRERHHETQSRRSHTQRTPQDISYEESDRYGRSKSWIESIVRNSKLTGEAARLKSDLRELQSKVRGHHPSSKRTAMLTLHSLHQTHNVLGRSEIDMQLMVLFLDDLLGRKGQQTTFETEDDLNRYKRAAKMIQNLAHFAALFTKNDLMEETHRKAFLDVFKAHKKSQLYSYLSTSHLERIVPFLRQIRDVLPGSPAQNQGLPLGLIKTYIDHYFGSFRDKRRIRSSDVDAYNKDELAKLTFIQENLSSILPESALVSPPSTPKAKSSKKKTSTISSGKAEEGASAARPETYSTESLVDFFAATLDVRNLDMLNQRFTEIASLKKDDSCVLKGMYYHENELRAITVLLGHQAEDIRHIKKCGLLEAMDPSADGTLNLFYHGEENTGKTYISDPVRLRLLASLPELDLLRAEPSLPLIFYLIRGITDGFSPLFTYISSEGLDKGIKLYHKGLEDAFTHRDNIGFFDCKKMNAAQAVNLLKAFFIGSPDNVRSLLENKEFRDRLSRIIDGNYAPIVEDSLTRKISSIKNLVSDEILERKLGIDDLGGKLKNLSAQERATLQAKLANLAIQVATGPTTG